MKNLRRCFPGILVCTGFIFSCLSLAQAAQCEKWAAKAVAVQGIVEAKRSGDTQWQLVKLNDTFCAGDAIRVQKRSRADIALVNQPVLHLDQNTVITLGGVKDNNRSLVDMAKGAAHFFSRVARGLEVQTAFVNAGVEGTEFFIRVGDDKTELTVFEGKVLAANKEGTLAVTGGQSATAAPGKAPAAVVVVRPRDAVQWALYYPPVVSYRPDQYQDGGWQGMVKKSLESYWKGDLAGAFSGIEGAPADTKDPRFFVYRASLLLTVGRVDEAGADIDRALSLDPQNSDAMAVQSIIALTQNQNEKAMTLAKKAVEAGPQSATAKVALSYAQQASFDLEAALASANEAVKLDPQNALAWARVAELQLSFGKRKEASAAAGKAVALNPDLSRTQTVLGFAQLAEARIKQGQEAFAKAITLDNADPLPRLGLGLAKIRQGNLNEGARDIEIAASLNPDSALIRSYLGKAFFEEKRDKQATEELGMAKQLDPNDPTAFFYDAILKQLTNRPVEALNDAQTAIDVNDNRAVYRSRLLLDADLAARSAGLARIYTDLGFEQLALNEGWKSENADPADFSGHRFLADTYSALPRREIARVSELLQSELLQPLNINPVQPHLAESNQFIIGGAGPSDLSSNEFNPLFNRDRVALQASGIVGNDSTSGEEVSLAGIYKNASVSVGQFHYKTDGFRDNDDIKDTIYNAFVQVSLSPQTSVQAEYRQRKTEKGDLTLRFLPDDFYPNQRNNDETSSSRFGFHHAFSAGSDLIGSVMYQDRENTFHDEPATDFFTDQKTDERAYGGELQHLLRLSSLKLITGAGYFRTHGETITDFSMIVAPTLPPFSLGSETIDINILHNNFYAYSYINVLKNVTVTIAGSYDYAANSNLENRSEFNPKFGLTWNPVADTTVRAAYFRVLKRTLITNQTLEPTQVAGFNQFFDDYDSTEAWNRGIAVDQKFSKHVFGGAEWSTRDLTVPFTDYGTGVVSNADWDEKFGRAYLYWTPSDWVGITTEYQYEKFSRSDLYLGVDRVKEVTTQRLPVGVNFYHPSGFSVMVKGTYYDQKGEFLPQGPLQFDQNGNIIFVSSKDNFWLFDAAISYRLPQRYGMITVGGQNLFDRKFQYADMDPVSPTIRPKRFVYARATVSF